MIQPLTIFHIIVLIISPSLASAQEDGITAQYGCNSTCGTVSVPFPFGMNEPHCYAHKWFEIECKFDNNTSSDVPKPYLKSLNLQVSAFNLYLSMVEIMSPIYHSNCQENKISINNRKTVNLRDSPYIFSQAENTFLAVGCNNLAFLQSNGTTVGGCVSICDDDNNNSNNFNFNSDGCNGRYCCATSLPSHLSEFNATLRGLREQSSDGCGYALITNDNRILFDSSDNMNTDDNETLNELKNMEYASAMLEWEILNDMLINSTFQLPPNCYNSKVTSLSNRTTGRQCQCSSEGYPDYLYLTRGIYGNPYLGGCTVPKQHFYRNNRWKKWVIVGMYKLHK